MVKILYEYSWVPVIVIIFTLIPYLAILLKRLIVKIVKRLSGAEGRERRASEVLLLRYRSPDWKFFCEHLGRSIPTSLINLYSDCDIGMWPIVKLKDREVRLCPIDKSNLSSGTAELLGYEVVPLAFDDCGQVIYMKPGQDNPDSVYVYDGDVEEVLFKSVEEFIEQVGCKNIRRNEPAK